MRAKTLIALATIAFGVALTPDALAFCRTTTCTPKTCVPAGECQFCLSGGLPLYWPGGCVSFSVQYEGSPLRGITAQLMTDIVTQSLAQWISVDCGGGQGPGLKIFQTPDVECRQQEYNQDEPNANIWMFRDDFWPYAGSGSTLALTTVTFNVQTGEIFDADVEVNSIENPLTVGDAEVQADLPSIVVHEAGHFLGLSHSCDNSATMFAQYKFGDTSLRSLEGDDVAGICTVYPPGSGNPSCDPVPRHGFSPECGTGAEEKGCCATAPGRPGTQGSSAALAGLLLGGALVLRRARMRRACRSDRSLVKRRSGS